MKNIFCVAFLLFLMIACKNKKNSVTVDTNKDTVAIQPALPASSQKVIYKSATYYTGRVDFYFLDEKGNEVVVGVSNMPEDSGALYPGTLLESSDTLEGPPAENPAMVGKPFLLIKNKAGEVREIKAIN